MQFTHFSWGREGRASGVLGWGPQPHLPPRQADSSPPLTKDSSPPVDRPVSTSQPGTPQLCPQPSPGLSPAGPPRGCAGSDLNPPSGPPTDRRVSPQEPPARGLPAARGSPQAVGGSRRLSPPPSSPRGPQAAEALQQDRGLPGWAVPGAEVGGAQVGELLREGVFKSRTPRLGGPCKPGHCGCRRRASGQGPGGSGGGLPSARLPQRAPPPGPHGVVLCLCPGRGGEAQGSSGQPGAPDNCPLCALASLLGCSHPSDLTRLLLLLRASRERFVGTKMV